MKEKKKKKKRDMKNKEVIKMLKKHTGIVQIGALAKDAVIYVDVNKKAFIELLTNQGLECEYFAASYADGSHGVLFIDDAS